MRIFSFILLLLVIEIPSTYSQNISGYILDKQTGEPLVRAAIFEPKTEKGVTSNEYGFFSLTLPRGQIQLVASYVGYQPLSFDFHLQKDTILNIHLEVLDFQEVIVRETQAAPPKTDLSIFTLPLQQLKTLPMLGGESDVLKALSLTPGVSTGTEGSTGLFVRGGTPDQNLILLDGATVYNPSHLFGFLSVFNTDALKNIDLYKGNFPARYGGRLSSVLDITLKEGNNQAFHGKIGIGLIASNLTLEGPILKNKTSFLFTARTSYLDAFTFWSKQQFERNQIDQYFNYNLYDLTAKINHQFSDKHRLFFSFYRGKDFLNVFYKTPPTIIENNTLQWGNLTFSLRFNQKISNRLFAKYMAYYTQYHYQLNSAQTMSAVQNVDSVLYKTSYLNQAQVKDGGLKINFDYLPNHRHSIKFGTDVVRHFYTPQDNFFLSETDSLSFRNTQSYVSYELAAYIEDKITLRQNLDVHVGLRLSGFQVQKSFYSSFEPRLSISYTFAQQYVVKAAYTHTKQFIHLLTNNSVGLPNDIWVGSTDKVEPQKVEMWAMGLSKAVPTIGVEASVEAYYKKMNHLIDYQSGVDFVQSFTKSWEDIVETEGVGTAYGVEFFLHKKTGKFNGWVGYTLSWNYRQFEHLNRGNRFPFKYDRRHDFSIVTNYQINQKWTLSFVWVFATGTATTLPKARYDSPFDRAPFRGFYYTYPDRNSNRMPNYHRADISVSYQKETKKGNLQTFNFSIYNLYNRLNPHYLIIRANGEWNEQTRTLDNPRTEMAQVGLIPFFPSLYYAFSF